MGRFSRFLYILQCLLQISHSVSIFLKHLRTPPAAFLELLPVLSPDKGGGLLNFHSKNSLAKFAFLHYT